MKIDNFLELKDAYPLSEKNAFNLLNFQKHSKYFNQVKLMKKAIISRISYVRKHH